MTEVKGAVSSIETFGLVDGPGIRTVVFLSGCKLRCKYCHNPETWVMGEYNYTALELADRILRNKNYFKRKGGVTFSGGEPLLQSKFIISVVKILKEEGIHVAIDTAGVGNGDYEEILDYVDLVLLDIKHVDRDGYFELTSNKIDESLKFIECLNRSGKKVWIRQVIVPGIMDNTLYLEKLSDMIKKINNVEKIEFLPYHKLGSSKYDELGIVDPYKDMEAMDKERCKELYDEFMEIYNRN